MASYESGFVKVKNIIHLTILRKCKPKQNKIKKTTTTTTSPTEFTILYYFFSLVCVCVLFCFFFLRKREKTKIIGFEFFGTSRNDELEYGP